VSTPYQRGAAFEHRVKADLEREEWLVVRSPASKSPFDLLAVKLDSRLIHVVALVQCKLGGKITRAEEAELTDVCSAFGCCPILAYTLKLRGEVHYRDLYSGESWVP